MLLLLVLLLHCSRPAQLLHSLDQLRHHAKLLKGCCHGENADSQQIILSKGCSNR